MTTVLVTHDQEEALDVADTIAVMDAGEIAQTGGPRELYDAPTSDFVMSFLGPVARLGDGLVRPHDLELSLDAQEGALEAQVVRVVHLGFEVRVELALADTATPADGSAQHAEHVVAHITRAEEQALELGTGDIVWIRQSPATGARVTPAPRPAPAEPDAA